MTKHEALEQAIVGRMVNERGLAAPVHGEELHVTLEIALFRGATVDDIQPVRRKAGIKRIARPQRPH